MFCKPLLNHLISQTSGICSYDVFLNYVSKRRETNTSWSNYSYILSAYSVWSIFFTWPCWWFIWFSFCRFSGQMTCEDDLKWLNFTESRANLLMADTKHSVVFLLVSRHEVPVTWTSSSRCSTMCFLTRGFGWLERKHRTKSSRFIIFIKHINLILFYKQYLFIT